MNCTLCRKEYTIECTYNQGRCPHHPPLIGNKMEIQPKDTSKGHFYVSLAKSGIRILAGTALIYGLVFEAGCFLILAEVLGVVEELV